MAQQVVAEGMTTLKLTSSRDPETLGRGAAGFEFGHGWGVQQRGKILTELMWHDIKTMACRP